MWRKVVLKIQMAIFVLCDIGMFVSAILAEFWRKDSFNYPGLVCVLFAVVVALDFAWFAHTVRKR